MNKIVLIIAAGVNFCAFGMEGQLPNSSNTSHDLPLESNRFIQRLLAVSILPMEIDKKDDLSTYDKACAGVDKSDYVRKNNKRARKLFNDCPSIKEQRAAAIKRARSEQRYSINQLPFLPWDNEEKSNEATFVHGEATPGFKLRKKHFKLRVKAYPFRAPNRPFDDEFNNDDSALN